MANFPVHQTPPWLIADRDLLMNQYRQDRLPHGILLVGHIGDGREVLTDQLIQSLFCTQLQGSQACGECKSCQLFASGHHPDYVRIDPEGKSQTIKVDTIRSIVQKVTATAQQGGNKVVRIESAETMNTNAANALLKILEEPAANTYIFLATAALSRLLPTLRSRCRIQTLARPTPEQSIDYLSLHSSQQPAELALNIADGRPLAAAALTEQDIQRWQQVEQSFATANQFMELSRFIAAEDMTLLVRQILSWIDAAIRTQQLNTPLAAGTHGQLVQRLANQDAQRLFSLRDYLLDKLSALTRQSNLNPQMMAEGIASQWLAVGR